MWATFLIFKTLPKVSNHPMDENAPNLVTRFEKMPFLFVSG
jgi:hypothetical protein